MQIPRSFMPLQTNYEAALENIKKMHGGAKRPHKPLVSETAKDPKFPNQVVFSAMAAQLKIKHFKVSEVKDKDLEDLENDDQVHAYESDQENSSSQQDDSSHGQDDEFHDQNKDKKDVVFFEDYKI